jgi:restriction endonuclease S subunit
MNYYPLWELAEIQTGITLRGPDTSRKASDGTHRLIRIGDVSSEGVISRQSSARIKVPEKDTGKFDLNMGNVLLAARGSRLTAAVFNLDEPAVAGSQFIIIRIRPQWLGLRPGFLVWFLNLPTVQEQLAARMRGTYIRSLPASVLAQLQVPVPDGAKQDAIIALNDLRIHEKVLMEQLAHQRSQLVEQLAITSINFNPHDNHVLG